MNVLLAGETFSAMTSVATGADVITGATWSNGALAFNAALADAGIAVTQIGGERCGAEFPVDLATLQRYRAVVISDVGALTLLVTPDTRAGRTGVNRLELLKTYVEDGGGLVVAGGYMGFQGMFGTARFYDTAVEDVLPVRCLPFSDGLEAPEGLSASVVQKDHPLLDGIDGAWPPILGLNKLDFRADGSSQLIASCPYRGTNWPLLAVRQYGKGRTVAWATDIGPHWLSQQFVAWEGYPRLMVNMIDWVSVRHDHHTRHQK
ncbi:hypothetical protein ASD50_15645 [Mesorhizobium sp. Root552]|uniref:glutamine amidotransferase n=1 Tax=Mesorhizobium sp. Root552 TaxID=1736555 RepID=UPI000702372D|nr:glutamine amidotransferase [Mesorhizobium sp. Root552]KQZ31281.1 hypothetical protein ASD50_15645 [Mesorhizobium sp. Root552]